MASKKVCERCGTTLNEQAKFCPECGNQVSGGTNEGFRTLPPCPNCGHPMTVDPQNLGIIKCPACGLTQVDISRQEKQLEEKRMREDKEKAKLTTKRTDGTVLAFVLLFAGLSIGGGGFYSKNLDILSIIIGALLILAGIYTFVSTRR